MGSDDSNPQARNSERVIPSRRRPSDRPPLFPSIQIPRTASESERGWGARGLHPPAGRCGPQQVALPSDRSA